MEQENNQIEDIVVILESHSKQIHSILDMLKNISTRLKELEEEVFKNDN